MSLFLDYPFHISFCGIVLMEISDACVYVLLAWWPNFSQGLLAYQRSANTTG